MGVFEDAVAKVPIPWLSLAATTVIAYAVTRCVYLLYFHPASKFPGPKLAAISYTAYCYYWIRGRYPWFQEAMCRKYGEAVRVGPNEILFYTPKAAQDIYGITAQHHEYFVKTDLMDFGAGDLGFIWENDPAKRKEVARKILPAFSTNATKAKEPTVQKYMDYFVSRMQELGGSPEGLLMNDWLRWLAADVGADLAYNRELHQMRDARTSEFLEFFLGSNFIGMLIQLSKKIPILALSAPFFMPLRLLRSKSEVFKMNSAAVKARIDNRGNTKHPDFLDYLVSPEDPPPRTQKEIVHIEQVALQMFIAGYDPIQVTLYAVLFFLMKNPKCHAILTKEIRDTFKTYEEITPNALVSMKYTNAIVQETLRLHLGAATGLPRLSPGTMVDGVFVPKGVVCQLSMFTAMRHERYFTNPLDFHPERWLPSDHPQYETKYAGDNLKAIFPFSIGPRKCTGKEIAWSQTRLFLAKVLWTFDLEAIRGHEKSFDKDFTVHLLWNRPDLYVRFVPARGQDCL